MSPTYVYAAVCLLGSVTCAVPSDVRAADLRPIDRRFDLSLGVFFLNTDTKVRVDGASNQTGTEVDFGKTFGVEDQDRFRIDGYWRFADRHKLRFMYFDEHLGATRTISEDISFRGVLFPLDASVRTDVDLQIVEVAYEYSFMRASNFELAGTIGLHDLSLSTKLKASTSSVPGGGSVERTAQADGHGPLPVVGMRALWALSDHFYFDAQAQFFALKLDTYDGHLEDYKVSAVWQPLEHFGVGVGYNSFVTRLNVDATRFTGKLRFEYGGPLAFVSLAF